MSIINWERHKWQKVLTSLAFILFFATSTTTILDPAVFGTDPAKQLVWRNGSLIILAFSAAVVFSLFVSKQMLRGVFEIFAPLLRT